MKTGARHGRAPRKAPRPFERTVRTRRVYSGSLLNIDVLDVELDNGVRSTREIVRHGGAAAVLAEIPGRGFVLVRQFRKPVEREVLEIVAGCLEPGEKPGQCAVREVKEETGYTVRRLRKLGTMWPSPGYSAEVLHLFHAVLEAGRGQAQPDKDERVRAVCLGKRQLERLIIGKRIRDAKTMVAWSLWKAGKK